MSTVRTRVRSLPGGAALVAFLLLSSCSSDRTSAPTTSVAPATGATSTAPSTSGPAGSSAGTTAAPGTSPSPVVTVPPATLLQKAVTARSDKYHFRSTVTVNGVVTLTAEGDRIGTSSRLDLASKGATVSYIITPAGSWAKPEGGEWSAVSATSATADPIASLRHPTKVALLSHKGTVDRLKVTVPASALGVATTGSADVTVTLSKGALTRLDYSATASGGTASVSNELSPVADATPITAPK